VEKRLGVWQATDDDMAHARCILYNEGQGHTLGVCNIYCLYTGVIVT